MINFSELRTDQVLLHVRTQTRYFVTLSKARIRNVDTTKPQVDKWEDCIILTQINTGDNFVRYPEHMDGFIHAD